MRPMPHAHRLGALQNPIDVAGPAPIALSLVDAVGCEQAGLDIMAINGDGRQPRGERELRDLRTLRKEQPVHRHDGGLHPSAKVTTAELTRDRMKAALPKLRDALQQASAREYEISWRRHYEATEGELDTLAAELAEVYPDCVERLVSILGRIPALNARVAHINHHAPRGVGDRLQYVEQAARGVDGFAPSGWPHGLFSLMSDLKLPRWKFDDDGDRYQYAWPPPQPSLAAQMASAQMPRSIAGPDWHSLIDERDRQRREESERLSAFYEKQEREAEKRREAELREAREAHRREYGY